MFQPTVCLVASAADRAQFGRRSPTAEHLRKRRCARASCCCWPMAPNPRTWRVRSESVACGSARFRGRTKNGAASQPLTCSGRSGQRKVRIRRGAVSPDHFHLLGVAPLQLARLVGFQNPQRPARTDPEQARTRGPVRVGVQFATGTASSVDSCFSPHIPASANQSTSKEYPRRKRSLGPTPSLPR